LTPFHLYYLYSLNRLFLFPKFSIHLYRLITQFCFILPNLFIPNPIYISSNLLFPIVNYDILHKNSTSIHHFINIVLITTNQV